MKRGFSLIEVLLVILIFSFLFGAILTVLTSQHHSWQVGYKKMAQQQMAKKAMNEITKLMRQSSTSWEINGAPPSYYPVTITANTQLDFYIPNFYKACCPGSCVDPDDPNDCFPDCCPNCFNPSVCQNPHNADEIRSLSKVTFRLGPADSDQLHQLFKKVGSAAEVAVAYNIKSLTFGCGCSGYTVVDSNCPTIKVDIEVGTRGDIWSAKIKYNQSQEDLPLTSKITLRNTNIILPDDVTVDQGES